ncbi:ArsR/SmtB family transcription factor [Desulfosporosinus fructosivorans]
MNSLPPGVAMNMKLVGILHCSDSSCINDGLNVPVNATKSISISGSLTSNHTVAYNWCMWNKGAIFKALSDSTRRLILDELSERNELTLYELTVRLITKHDLKVSRQAIAKHLSVLDDAGLVKSKRKGKYRVLMFNNEPLKNLLKGWIE